MASGIREPTTDAAPAYAELHCRSYFSFLDGASAPEELVERAHELGYAALAITDVDGVYALPRAHQAAKKLGLRLVLGSELTCAEDAAGARAFRPDGRIVLLALDEPGWRRLCRLITAARMRHEKGRACAAWDEVAADTTGLVALSGGADGPIDRALARQDLGTARRWAGRLREAFGARAHMELTCRLRPGDDERLEALDRLAREERLPRVVTQDARYATPERRVLHDVQTCVRLGTTLAAAGRQLAANGEAHLAARAHLARRFTGWREGMERSVEIARQASFSLEALRYRFPACRHIPAGETPFSYLHHLTMQGARERYRPMTPRAAAQLAHELAVIEKLKLAGYFLIVWEIVNFCREQKILAQGRGSAANSAVCYALGITAVDPVGMGLLFERFLSEERTEMPDIDIDIGHQRREEVLQWVYARYGRQAAAMANEVITFRARSALRDVGKAFGLSLAQIDVAAKAVDRFESDGQTPEPEWSVKARLESLGVRGAAVAKEVELEEDHPRHVTATSAKRIAAGEAERPRRRREAPKPEGRVGELDLGDETVRRVIDLARAFDGFPRHLGIHSGGMVLAEGDLCDVVPIENASMPGRSVVQWDKDDLNGLGIVKIDLLGLGMLTVVDEALQQVSAWRGEPLELHQIPADDPDVYDMICAGDTVGVFQIESRAQMSMLPRLRPRTFYDLVIEVAIIRPGPIQGDMVHPFLRRRRGEEPVEYPHRLLEPVLRRTLGVPLFQEQGMKLAIVAAGFTPGEADELRRAMGHKRSHERMARLKARLIEGMAKNGIGVDVGERLFKELSAFADYGFPESHAASFALIVYASAWLKRRWPAAFLAALLNAQPMGFYAPHTLVADARRHGVAVRPPCARRSGWGAQLEGEDATAAPAVRLGISSVRGAGEAVKEPFDRARAERPFRSLGDFARRSGLSRTALEHLAAGDGFAGFGLTRREALWQVAALPRDFASLEGRMVAEPDPVALPPMTTREELTADFVGLGLSIDRNPVALARAALAARGVLSAADFAETTRPGQRVSVAGMVIVRQRPATAKGMVFMTLEDETGLANLVFTPDVFARLRPVARDEPLVVAHGKVERQGDVVNLRVDGIDRLDAVVGGAASSPAVAPRNFH